MAELRRTAARLGKSQSHVVTEAVAEYAARSDRLTEHERRYVLNILAKVTRATPRRGTRVTRRTNR
jgi:hypothetical protein